MLEINNKTFFISHKKSLKEFGNEIINRDCRGDYDLANLEAKKYINSFGRKIDSNGLLKEIWDRLGKVK